MFYKKLKGKELKVFIFYEIFLTIFGIISNFYFKEYESNSYYWLLLQIYLICDYIIISIFFYNIYQNKIAKKVALIVAAIYALINIFAYIYINNSFYSSIVIEYLLIIINSVYFFYEKIKKVDMDPLYKRINFWIVVGFFISASGNIFAFVYRESLTNDKLILLQIFYIYVFITLSKNLIFSSAIIFGKEPKKQQENISVPENLYLDDFPSNDNTA